MHKGVDFLDKMDCNGLHEEYSRYIPNIVAGKKNIVFIDIDGVLQPYSYSCCRQHDYSATIDYIAEKYHSEVLREEDVHDVCAAFYDWDEVAMGRLANILRRTGSYLVVSSGWREFNRLDRFKAFFDFYGLGDYVLDICEPDVSAYKDVFEDKYHCFPESKAVAIYKWLAEHDSEVNNYIVIDDHDMSMYFGSCFVATRNILQSEDQSHAMRMLLRRKNGSADIEDGRYHIGIADFNFRICDIEGKQAVFFKLDTVNRAYMIEQGIRYEIHKFIEDFGSIMRGEQYRNVHWIVWLTRLNGSNEKSPDIYNLNWREIYSETVIIRIKRCPGAAEFGRNAPIFKPICDLADKLWNEL